ncbi:MAG TPA: hypothetical protein VEO54_26755, partial [Thermoanaerobaculia bacterium]|nr:hypothetical protein [Thermoanaerobaculia bacterium]
VRLADALRGAVHLAMDARAAVEVARRLAPPPPEGHQPSADVDPILLLRRLERVAVEIDEISREAKIAS